MQRLLNISTHPGEPELFDDNWNRVREFLHGWEFDGFELYPVGNYPFSKIPADIMTGLHLRFFAILAPIWRGDSKRLLEIFGDWETVELFYGGRDAEWVASFYARQLDLAHRMGCAYVVFHPVHCEMEYIYNWRFPWKLNDTLDMCAEVVNAATRRSAFDGLFLFENLWWPGSFRLDSPREYDYLLSRIDYPRCGIALDTGHLLNKNPGLADEREATEYMLDCIDGLGDIAGHIHTVHLTKSLSGDYIRRTRRMTEPFSAESTFWERFSQVCAHVACIDRHDPFETPGVSAVLERVAPAHVVFEFTFSGMGEWEKKIATQKQALRDCLWPCPEPIEEHCL